MHVEQELWKCPSGVKAHFVSWSNLEGVSALECGRSTKPALLGLGTFKQFSAGKDEIISKKSSSL